MFFRGLRNVGVFVMKTQNTLPKHVVGLTVIGILCMLEYLPRLQFGHFHSAGCGSSCIIVPRMQSSCGFVLKSWLVAFFA